MYIAEISTNFDASSMIPSMKDLSPDNGSRPTLGKTKSLPTKVNEIVAFIEILIPSFSNEQLTWQACTWSISHRLSDVVHGKTDCEIHKML